MIQQLKITILFTALSLIGFTQVGKYTSPHLNSAHNITTSNHTLANQSNITNNNPENTPNMATADQLNDTISITSMTHGYTNEKLVTEALIFGTIIIMAYIIFRIICSRFNIKKTKAQKISWYTVSMLVTSILSAYGVYIIYPIVKLFIGNIAMPYFFGSSNITDLGAMQNGSDLKTLVDTVSHVKINSIIMRCSILVSMYFLIDIIINRPDWIYYLHHAIGLFWAVTYYLLDDFAFYVACSFVTEISTNVLSATIYTKRGSTFKRALQITFAVTFFLCRVLFIPIILAIAIVIERGWELYVIVSAYTPLLILNYFWFWLICKKFWKLFCGPCKRSQDFSAPSILNVDIQSEEESDEKDE